MHACMIYLISQLAMYFVCKMIMSIGQMLLMLNVSDAVYAYCIPLPPMYCRTIGIVLFFCATIDHFLLYQLAIKECACTMYFQLCC